MAYTTINKHTDFVNTVTYTGNGGTNAITGVGHQPDWVWLKRRDGSGNHNLYDAVRGVTKYLESSATSPEQTQQYGLTTFGTDGFTLGSNANMNGNGQSFVSWNWKAGTGQGSSNTDGSINTTYTSANTTAGFSISKYTGTGSSATIGHGLGASPDVVIIKKTSAAEDWNFQTSALGYGNYLVLNGTGASSSAGGGLVSAVSSTTVTVDSNSYVNSSGATYVMYCFAEKTGYSKFGKYIGNGNADGTFVYTGFKPAWILLKRSNSGGTSWLVYDNKREGYNVDNDHLQANGNNSEGTSDDLDILSNGFKLRTSGSGENGSGNNYIYMAFGQSLVGSNNVPCTAR